MIRKLLGIVLLTLLALVLLSVVSCGRDQELVSIQIQPAVETFGASNILVQNDAGLQVQLKAYGTYIHPPVTKDVSSQVAWFSNDTQMMTVDSGGMLTATGITCGTTLVSASITTNKSSGGIGSGGAVVTGFMTGNVVCDTGSSGSGSPALTVTFGGSGTGTISSNPPNLSCDSSAGVCSALFPGGTQITLTATPSSTSSFGSWSNCDSASNVNPCTLTLTSSRAVVATFN